MDVTQKNVFGDNIVLYGAGTRELTPEGKSGVLSSISNCGASRALIRFQEDRETTEFAEKVAEFLVKNNIEVLRLMSIPQSGIPRNEFIINRHPSDTSVVIIEIGTM